MSRELYERTNLLDSLLQALRENSKATVLFHTMVAQRLGLNTTDHKVLDIISRSGPIVAGQLAELTGLTTGAVTGVIDRLEKAGYVRRVRDLNDRRKVIVQPVPESAFEINPLFTSIAQKTTKLLARYSTQELTTILDFATRSTRMVQEETAKLRMEEAKQNHPK